MLQFRDMADPEMPVLPAASPTRRRTTPTPSAPPRITGTVTFARAIQAVIDGQRATRQDWKTRASFMHLSVGYLYLRKEDGIDYRFTLRDVDLKATDWEIF